MVYNLFRSDLHNLCILVIHKITKKGDISPNPEHHHTMERFLPSLYLVLLRSVSLFFV